MQTIMQGKQEEGRLQEKKEQEEQKRAQTLEYRQKLHIPVAQEEEGGSEQEGQQSRQGYPATADQANEGRGQAHSQIEGAKESEPQEEEHCEASKRKSFRWNARQYQNGGSRFESRRKKEPAPRCPNVSGFHS
jgi:hypothetical protein